MTLKVATTTISLRIGQKKKPSSPLIPCSQRNQLI